MRDRPSFFPFTEPSGEVDLLLTDKTGKESWVEMGGCGRVDPNVFDAVGIDSEKYTGWALASASNASLCESTAFPTSAFSSKTTSAFSTNSDS